MRGDKVRGGGMLVWWRGFLMVIGNLGSWWVVDLRGTLLRLLLQAKKCWHLRLKQEGSSHLQEFPVFPFSNAILLRCVRASGLVNDSLLAAKFFERLIEVFSSIIRAEDLNPFIILSVHHLIELNEFFRNLGFFFQQVQPCHPREIVNEQYEISIL